MNTASNPEFEKNVVRDSGGKFSEKNVSEQPGGTRALTGAERHITSDGSELVIVATSLSNEHEVLTSDPDGTLSVVGTIIHTTDSDVAVDHGREWAYEDARTAIIYSGYATRDEALNDLAGHVAFTAELRARSSS